MSNISIATDGAIRILRIRGADERNLLTPDTYLEIADALVSIENDDGARALILTGAGDRHFSQGADLQREHELRDQLGSRDAILERYWYPTRHEPYSDMAARELYATRITKPVVAAIRGDCFGAALILIGLHTDIRIVAENARFGFTQLRHGFGGGSAVLSGLARQMPRVWLNWLIDTSDIIDAARARDLYLVNEVVADESLDARALEVARSIAARDPRVVRLEKLALTALEGSADADVDILVGALAIPNA